MVRTFRGCLAHGKAEPVVLFLFCFFGFLIRLFDLFLIWHLFGFYLAFLHGFVLWKLHEINFIRSVVLFCVPEIFC